MAYSKVILNGTTIMDVTQDTVTAETLLSGETATKADGTRTTGTYTPSGGSSELCVFSEIPYANTDVSVGGAHASPNVAYRGANIVEGAAITFYTYSDYILNTITGTTSGNTYPYTTVSRGQYTFTMPSESVYCALLYDD